MVICAGCRLALQRPGRLGHAVNNTRTMGGHSGRRRRQPPPCRVTLPAPTQLTGCSDSPLAHPPTEGDAPSPRAFVVVVTITTNESQPVTRRAGQPTSAGPV